MILFKWKSNTFFYLLSLFKDLELKLKFKSEFKSEFELKLLLLLILGITGAGAYQISINHKKDMWITTDLKKHNMKQLLLCYSHSVNHAHQLHDHFD